MTILIVLFTIIIICCFVIWLGNEGTAQDLEKIKEKHAIEKDRVRTEVLSCCEKYGVGIPPSDTTDAYGSYGFDFSCVNIKYHQSKAMKAWYWNDEKNLIFYNGDKDSDLEMFIIPFDNIEYFTKNGDVSYVNKVENVGKNISLSGTIVGGVIGGAAGAIIGSHKDANQLVNKTVSYDDCRVFIYYRNEAQDNLTVAEVESRSFYTKIVHILPEKDYNQIILNNSLKSTSEQDIQTRFDKLEQLYNNGIITEDEYQTKRNALLESI